MDEIIKEALDFYKLSSEADQDNRDSAMDDLKFARLGNQWPESVKKIREDEGRPCLTFNMLPSYIHQIVNEARQARPSIKISPVDDNADEDTAEVLTGLIRNIQYTSNADVAYDTALDHAVSLGFGYWRINTKYAYDDSFEQDLVIERMINPFAVYRDPHSTESDSCDWNQCLVIDTIKKEDFKKKYSSEKIRDWDHYDTISAPWVEESSVIIAEYWKRELVKKTIYLLNNGQVIDKDLFESALELFQAQGLSVAREREIDGYEIKQHILTSGDPLEENEWAGKYIPIVPCYGEEVFVEGQRYLRSLIRDTRDAQVSYNYHRSASVESIAQTSKAPYIGEEGSFVDPSKWAASNVKAYPYLEYKKGGAMPQRQGFAGIPAGSLQEALSSADDIKKILNMHEAALGAPSNEQSGRAIIARKASANVGNFHFPDNQMRAIRHTGRILLDMIPHVYKGDRIARILGENGKDSMNVRLGQGANKEAGIYDLSVGKYDIVIDTGPNYATARQEAAEQMIQLSQTNQQVFPLIADLVAENLDWPGADEIAERFKTMLPAQLQGQNPEAEQIKQQAGQVIQQMQQQLMQLQQQNQQLTQDKQLDAEKIGIEAYKAETDRAKAMQQGMTPEQIQAIVLQTMQQLMTPTNIGQ